MLIELCDAAGLMWLLRFQSSCSLPRGVNPVLFLLFWLHPPLHHDHPGIDPVQASFQQPLSSIVQMLRKWSATSKVTHWSSFGCLTFFLIRIISPSNWEGGFQCQNVVKALYLSLSENIFKHRFTLLCYKAVKARKLHRINRTLIFKTPIKSLCSNHRSAELLYRTLIAISTTALSDICTLRWAQWKAICCV